MSSSIQCSAITNLNTNFLNSKQTFERELIKIILTNGLSIRPRVDTVIFLPDTLTTSERHRIHTFGKKDKITSKTRVKDGKRVISITIKPIHVIGLIEMYLYGN
jgi:hypothetical protein